jgi:hypothetical protein
MTSNSFRLGLRETHRLSEKFPADRALRKFPIISIPIGGIGNHQRLPLRHFPQVCYGPAV